MGEVWLARNEATGAQVALKTLSAAAANEDGDERFRREARLGGLLSHRHIVQVFDLVEEENGLLVLVMEYLRGESLEAYLARVGPVTPREAVALLLPVLSALQHAHDARVMHRDVTPGNVFLAVDPDGHVIPKLVDFGIAKHSGTSFQTLDGEVLGTPAYMAPEAIRGHRDFDARSDLFSLGVVLFEAMTGTSPFAASTPQAALAAVLERPVHRDSRIEARLWSALARALSKERDERPESARAMAAALAQGIGAGAPADVRIELVEAPRVAPYEVSSVASSQVTAAAITRTRSPARESRARRAALAWALVGVVGVLAGGAALLGRAPEAPSASAAPRAAGGAGRVVDQGGGLSVRGPAEVPEPAPAVVPPPPADRAALAGRASPPDARPRAPDPRPRGVDDPPSRRPRAKPPHTGAPGVARDPGF